MVGQHSIAVTDIVTVDFFHGAGDFFMNLFFLLCQYGIVDHLSCEGMFEDVGRVRIDASFKKEFGIF